VGIAFATPLSIAGTPARADGAPRDGIAAESGDRVKDLVSPGVAWCIRHGWPITIVPTRQIDWPRAYKEDTDDRPRG